VLSTIIEKYEGGPVGLQTIAASISEEPDTIMDVVEPYLLQLGFLDRTPQGRVATSRAYQHLDIPYEESAQPRLYCNLENLGCCSANSQTQWCINKLLVNSEF
jgi:holliday junction DNA helicase RuvB